jgi:hypothetical protein
MASRAYRHPDSRRCPAPPTRRCGRQSSGALRRRARLVGWLTHRDVLQTYQRRLADAADRARSDRRGLGGFRVIALTLNTTAPPVGDRFSEVAWPPATRLMAIRRKGRSLPVASDTLRKHGDELTVLVPAEHADDPHLGVTAVTVIPTLA